MSKGFQRRCVLSIVLALAPITSSIAQTFPSKPVRFIAPFAAGGGSDLIARKLAQALTGALGQPVVVDNRTGGSGVVGTDIVAKSGTAHNTAVLCF